MKSNSYAQTLWTNCRAEPAKPEKFSHVVKAAKSASSIGCAAAWSVIDL
jgi:hypothetical protein